ncbi:mediator of DNA damage checkpoint protein 1 [Ctenodactylus gundi]
MEDTQAIDWDVEEEEETDQSTESLGGRLEPVGQLRLFSGVHGPEKDFPLYLGKNVVGRMPDCSVALPFPSISKRHAVIEISAWNKAPALQDCGSLNGTQILRPPKLLSPGVSHRLRDQELILFADLPCQYHRLDASLPFVSTGPPTVEENPRAQRDTQASGLLLAEDSEEEGGFLSERCVAEESGITAATWTVVPESDEEGPSPHPSGPGPSFAFNIDSDTDEDEGVQPAPAKAPSLARAHAAEQTKQTDGGGVTVDTQLVKSQPSVEGDEDQRVMRAARNGVVPVEVVLERSQLSGEDSDTDVDEGSRPSGRPTKLPLERTHSSSLMHSDTDVEEEAIPATPVGAPLRQRQIVHVAGEKGPGALRVAHLQRGPAGSEIDVEEGEVLLAVPLEGSQLSVIINSDTDDEEEVSVALTLACLKENRAVLWDKDTDTEKDGPQYVVLLEQNQTASGTDSDTDMEEEGLPVEKRESVPISHIDKDETLVSHSEGGHPPPGDRGVGEETDMNLAGICYASATVDTNTEVEEVPPGSVVTHLKKHHMPVEGTNRAAKLPVMPLEEAWPPDEDTASSLADVRKSQPLAEGISDTEWATPVREQESAPHVQPHASSVAQVEQVVYTDMPGEPPQAQREGMHSLTWRERKSYRGSSKDSKDSHDDLEDLDFKATQFFVKRENQSLEAVQNLEDEPTQAFPCILSPEPSPSLCSLQTSATLDEPWEVLSTQPFCVRESEASEPQPAASHLEGHGPCPSPRNQHPENPVNTESSGSQGRGTQTLEKGMDIPQESAERVTPEIGPPEGAVREWPPEREGEGVMEEEPLEALTRGIDDKEQKQVLAGDTHWEESDQEVKSESTERDRENLKVGVEPSEEVQEKEKEKQILRREVSERVLKKLLPDRECEPSGLEVAVERGEVQGGSQDPEGLAASPTPEPRAGIGHLQGLASAPAVSESQSRLEALSPQSNATPSSSIMPPSLSPPAREPPPTIRQGRTRRSSVKIPEPVIHAVPEPQHSTSTEKSVTPKPTSRTTKGRARSRFSVKTPEILEPTAPQLQPSNPIDQSDAPKLISRVTQGKTYRSFVKTSEPVVHIAPELQPSTSTDQLTTPRPTSGVPQGRTTRSSFVTPKPVEPTAPKFQPSTFTDQSITSKPTSRVTRGKINKSSAKTSEQVVTTTPKLEPSASTEQPVPSKPPSAETRGRKKRSSVKTSETVEPAAPKFQPYTCTDQPVTPRPTSWVTRGRARKSSIETLTAVESITPKLQPSTSTDNPVNPKPTSRGAQKRTCKSSHKTPEPVELSASGLELPTTVHKPASPEAADDSGTQKSSALSAATPPPIPEIHSVTMDQPVFQASYSRRLRAAGKHGSFIVPSVHKTCCVPPESENRLGTLRAAGLPEPVPEPSSHLPKALTHAPQIQNVEAAGRSGFSSEPQPKVSERRKRPSATTDSLLQKRPKTGPSQKTLTPKEEEEDIPEKSGKKEDVGKKKRDQTEESEGIPNRSLRRSKPNQQSTAAPKVLFTGVVDARGEQAVLALGGQLANSVAEASHLVTDRIRRTVKFLCALGRGIPILSLNWLHQSRKAGYFLPPDQYVVTDPELENKFGFILRDALRQARERRLLEGYEIYVTPGVQPPPLQMGEIISCCGGTILSTMPRSYKPRRVVITCPQDLPRCSIPSRVGLPLLSPEFLLTGVLKQEAKPEAFVLSTLEMSSD